MADTKKSEVVITCNAQQPKDTTDVPGSHADSTADG